MKLTPNEVKQYGFQMRLLFTQDELQAVTDSINNTLEMFVAVEKVNTENVAPLFFINDRQNVFRDDVVLPSLSREDALKNAPRHDDECFLFPPMIG